jgi:hypothetical protein
MMVAMTIPPEPEPGADTADTADTTGITISHEDHDRRGGFVAERDGKTLGEMDYSRPQTNLIIVEHTQVSSEARGTGVGRMLVDAVVAWARREHARVMPLCPYARSVFARDASIRDVLAE